MSRKVKVAIIGTGNIGTDLLIKVLRSEKLECVKFVGRNFLSTGMRQASELGVSCSDQSIEFFKRTDEHIDVVFDATSASAHVTNDEVFSEKGIVCIDMTPALIGPLTLPTLCETTFKEARNFNMVTCGGQASVPIAAAYSKVCKLDYVEGISSIASRSAGPATRDNLDEYINTTEIALKQFTNASKSKAILNLNPASPPIDMQTTVRALVDGYCNVDFLRQSVISAVEEVSKFVPGYKLVFGPVLEGNTIISTVRVKGNGDYLPSYAGNLDIINAAAISVAEKFFDQRGHEK